MKKINLLLIALLFLGFNFTKAQEDSTETNVNWDWHWTWNEWDDWKDWKVDFGFSHSNPAISLQYGMAKINREDINEQFVDPNLVELKLGYIKETPAWETDYILKQSYKYLFLSNTNNQLSGKEANGTEIESDMWRVGFGRSVGYGYKLGENSAIVLYNSYTINWSRIDFKFPDIMTINPLALFVYNQDLEVLKLYDEAFRFGTSGEGGIRVKALQNVMFDVGYERSVVFQRHLFWKWAGSALIEVVSQGLLNGFINEIFESSPAAGPIVNFILKNALTYGIYELRQDKMNWPFNSEAPVSCDQFKFGLTFMF